MILLLTRIPALLSYSGIVSEIMMRVAKRTSHLVKLCELDGKGHDYDRKARSSSTRWWLRDWRKRIQEGKGRFESTRLITLYSARPEIWRDGREETKSSRGLM
jgi:hypothetical protein